jgi:hypothetical protein
MQRRRDDLMGENGETLNWQPVTYPGNGKICSHAHLARVGWVADCDCSAAFVATDADGGHWYACAEHIGEMRNL